MATAQRTLATVFKAAGVASAHAHRFRHTFAVRYLMLGGDPFSLQELLGHEDMATIRNYMHLNDIHIQTQKRKFSPGDHALEELAALTLPQSDSQAAHVATHYIGA